MKLTWTTFKAMNTPTEWRARFTRNRWVLAWCGFAGLFLFMLMACSAFWDRPWLGNFLSAFGTGIAVILAILIYAHGQAAQARATREQMEHLQRLNQEEVVEMRKLFQQQMEHLAEQTNKQIVEYGRETLKVVHKLEEHSSLLAALLKRELEKAIANHNANVNEAHRQMRKIMGFQFGRSEAEKAQQVAALQAHIDRLNEWGNYIQQRHRQLTIEYNPKY
ncbi:MAG: hypothetical protein H6591_14040 [Flavobacteriales bacterium]|nr:hypothetical protein [Flavobacteriales bacterium]